MLGFWVIIYLIGTLIIGLGALRWVKDSSDFLAAGRKLPLMLSSFALFAFWFGSETVFGASAQFIEHGMQGVIEDPFGAFLCLILFATFFVRPLYRKNLLTIADLFRDTYGKRIELISSLFMLITFIGYIAAQLIALSILFEAVFGIDFTISLIISTAIVTAYTAAGGMWAVSITDFIQSIVIVVGLVLLSIHMFSLLEQGTNLELPNEDFLNFFPQQHTIKGWLEYLAAWISIGFGSLASQDIFQRANAAKSEKTAVISTYLGAFLYLIIAILPLFLGLLVHNIAPSLVEEDPQYALMALVKIYAPFWLQILFCGALISAIFSTCSGALLAPSSILSENIIRPFFKEKLTDKSFLYFSRLSVILIAVISLATAHLSNSIYVLVAESSILGLVSLLTPMSFALFNWPNSTTGAILSMILGMLAYLLFSYFIVTIIPAMLLGFLFSIIGMCVGNHLNKWCLFEI